MLGYGGLGEAGLDMAGRVIELEIERAGPCFARRVAGSVVVENLSPRNNPFGGNIVGRIRLGLDPTAANSRLSLRLLLLLLLLRLLRAPCQDFPYHYERFVTTPVEGGHAKAPEPVGPGEWWPISFGAVFISQ